MSQVSHFMCDGPTCLTSDEESITESALMESGWLIVSMVDPEEERTSHLCSYRCLVDWAEELSE